MRGGRAGRLNPRRWSLAGQLFAMQAAVILAVLIGAGVGAYVQASATNQDAAEAEVLTLATTVAATTDVREALARPNPTASLQPLAEQIRRDTGTDFIVVMSVSGIRYTHPNPAQIGGRFLGHIDPATRGHSFTETFAGTLGPSVRAVVPVIDQGQVSGLVAVGVTTAAVGRELESQLPPLIGGVLAALLLAGLGAWMVSRWLRRSTHELGPAELSRMYEYYDAMLHAVREGLILLDRGGRLVLCNDEAYRLLALPQDAIGRQIDDIGLPSRLGDALATGSQRADEIHLTADRIVVVNQASARWAGTVVGTVVTLRDHTELRALVSELKTLRGFADALHAQAHEAANQLHTVISLIELGRAEQALEFASAELADTQHLTDLLVSSVEEPELAALLLGKVAEAHERGVELVIADDISVPAGSADPRDLITIVGNLLDNALDAVDTIPPPRRVDMSARVSVEAFGRAGSEELILRIADNGPGLAPADIPKAFQRGWSTKPTQQVLGRGLGLALVAQAVHRQGGSIEIGGGCGAVFTVHLPLTGGANRPAAPEQRGTVGNNALASSVQGFPVSWEQ